MVICFSQEVKTFHAPLLGPGWASSSLSSPPRVGPTYSCTSPTRGLRPVDSFA